MTTRLSYFQDARVASKDALTSLSDLTQHIPSQVGSSCQMDNSLGWEMTTHMYKRRRGSEEEVILEITTLYTLTNELYKSLRRSLKKSTLTNTRIHENECICAFTTLKVHIFIVREGVVIG